MFLLDAVKRHVGWCPRTMPRKEGMSTDSEHSITRDTGGWGRNPYHQSGWWNIYHNQLLVMALLVTGATAVLFFLIGDVSEYRVVVYAIAVGLGSAIGFLASFERKYGQIATGKYVRGYGTGSERIKRYFRTLSFSVPATLVTLAACVMVFGMLGLVGQILWLMYGFSLASWISLCITLYWERRRQMTLISKSGSMYATGRSEVGP
jgi:hypothetical protein